MTTSDSLKKVQTSRRWLARQTITVALTLYRPLPGYRYLQNQPTWSYPLADSVPQQRTSANKGHLARTALEAIAFQARKVVEAMQRDAKIHREILRVDGGVADNDLLIQFQADILNLPVVRRLNRPGAARSQWRQGSF